MALPKASGIPTSNLQIFIALETSPVRYSALANVGDFGGPSMSRTVVDVSKHGDQWVRNVVTLKSGGTLPFPCWFDPSVPSLAGNSSALEELFISGDLRSWLLAFTDGSGIIEAGGLLLSFNAYVSKFSLKGPVKGVLSADTELLIDGEVTSLWATTVTPTGQPLP